MNKFKRIAVSGAALMTACGLSLGTVSASDEPFAVGFATFLSGPVSGPVGVPSRNGVELIAEAINESSLPSPYSGQGIGGRELAIEYVDEASETLDEYRNLVTRSGVDAVIGYASSGSCVSIAPEAEASQTLTLFYYCGSTRIFEEDTREYVFRTMNSQDVENIAAANYLAEFYPDANTIAGINQNYGWGQDSWRDFVSASTQLNPETEVSVELWPQIFAGQYGAELTRLARAGADVLHTSFWGGDLDAFLLQASPRGLLEDQIGVLTTGGTAYATLADQIPDGTVIGVRGNGGALSAESPLNDWFRATYVEKFGEEPTFPAYYGAQALLALKAAGDLAAAEAGSPPSVEQVRLSLKGIEYEAPTGTVTLSRHNGHQAATELAYGRVQRVDGNPTLVDIRRYSPDCVVAPDGYTSREWIEAGFPGAQCN